MMNVIEHGPYHTTEDNADPFTCNENSLRVVTKRMSALQKGTKIDTKTKILLLFNTTLIIFFI
jgi:hypothetical protein